MSAISTSLPGTDDGSIVSGLWAGVSHTISLGLSRADWEVAMSICTVASGASGAGSSHNERAARTSAARDRLISV